MEFLGPLTDKEYSQLRIKPTPNQKEQKFMEVYENVYLMQALSLIIAIPAIFYTRKTIRYKGNLVLHNPNFTQV